MASRRTKLFAGATTTVVGAGAYFLYSVMAVQGQGTLAQAPLNVQAQIPPAFIMGVDDSGSMSFETLFPGQDGQGCFQAGSFFNNDGTLRTSGTCGYNHVIPYTGHRIDGNRHAIAPIDPFGFARSNEFNPSYFDPAELYQPWLNSDNTPYGSGPGNPAGNASITATRANPRTATPTLNMTAVREETNGNLQFRLLNGMVLPTGTEYFTVNQCGGLGTTPATLNTWVALSAPVTVNATCVVGIRYFPASFYLRTTTLAPAGYLTDVVLPGQPGGRSLAAGACGPGCDMYRYEIKPANYATVADYDAAIQNFANWFSFYGNRNRAMIAGMTRSLVDVQNMRVGYFTINQRNTVAMRNMNVPADKALLYTSLLSLPISGGTPNLFAVDHMGMQFQRTGAGAPVQLACQKNAGMLFTDGYSNQNSPGAPAVTGLGPPFDPTPANSMAAIATRYYQMNLRPDLPAGRVPVPAACSAPSPDPRLDCRTDLHMNLYGVTLGARGSIYDPAAPRDPFVAPYPNWPGHTNDNPTTVDDIWHSAINTRGEFINARTPNAITAAMRRVLASVSAGSSPAGSIALTGARIGSGSLAVVPFYEARNDGTDWYSTLTAQTVSVAPGTGVVSFPTAWEATTRFPTGARGNIWYGRGNLPPAPFTSANVGTLDNLCNNPRPGMSLCTGAQIAALGGAPALTLDQAIDYLKGDQSLEVDTNPAGRLRFRTTVLGDIVNSTPVVSAPTDDYGYRGLPAPYGSSYSTYLTTTKASRRPMVYAGANDGMLHGFDGRTTPLDGGQERFAFIPQSVMGHMGNLLFPYLASNAGDQKFKHRYYVDGPVAVSDAYNGTAWRTVLVGSTGAGARGVFGLDVSDVSGTTGSFTAADRLWEISDLNGTLSAPIRNNIGHVLGRPVVVPVKTGSATGPVTWRAIFGNGYNSQTGNAVLFMVDIGTGAPQVRMLEARESGAPAAGTNGLGNIVVVDRWGAAGDNTLTARTRDGFADTVYAADQKGAIWKFDLRDTVPVNTLPAAANQTVPVFTTQTYTTGPETGTRQPIIGGLTAAQGPGGGVLVYFGTGSFSFEGDPTDSSRQSLYAVLDQSNGNPTTTIARTDMLQQTIGTTTGGTRSTSSNVATVLRSGWYLDLPLGERFVGYPRLESGLLFMPTYAPNSATECTTAGVNWLYGLNALSGAAGLSNVRFGSPTGTSPGSGTGAVSLDTQGTAPVKDVAVLTTPRLPPLGPGATPAELADALAAQCSMVIQVAGAPALYLPRPCGRQSWRQIQ